MGKVAVDEEVSLGFYLEKKKTSTGTSNLGDFLQELALVVKIKRGFGSMLTLNVSFYSSAIHT